MGFFKNLFGGGDEVQSPEFPDFAVDPAFAETQGFLKDFGMDILKGDVPEYYKGIGETGGKAFEDMLDLTKRDITKSTQETLAASGRARGGQLPASTAKAVGDVSIKARFDDYLRSLAGKQSLLSTGVGVTEGVRSAGAVESAAKRRFDVQKFDSEIDERNFQVAKQAEEDAQFGQLIGTIASMGMGAATGGMSFGFQGALAGGVDALTGGGTSFLSNLGKSVKKKEEA